MLKFQRPKRDSRKILQEKLRRYAIGGRKIIF